MSTPSPRDRDRATVPPASDLIAELGGAFCPSLSGMLERLIDRQAANTGHGVRS
jgi:hypothetical protein